MRQASAFVVVAGLALSAGVWAAVQSGLGELPPQNGTAAASSSPAAAGDALQTPATVAETMRRYSAAQQMLAEGRHVEATEEFLWLWRNTDPSKDAAFVGVRVSFIANDMKALVGKHEPANGKFTALRDETQEVLRKWPNDDYVVLEWLVLNDMIDDRQATLKWFDSVKNDPARSPQLQLMSHLLQPILLTENRWADVGRLYMDPLAALERDLAMERLIPDVPAARAHGEDVNKILQEMHFDRARESAATIYAAMLAAGRDGDAAKVAARAREHDPSGKMKMALVRTALIAGEPRAEHLEWLHEASKQGEATDGLFQQVEAALLARS